MSWSILPKPGSEYGPCKGECKHTDCAKTRSMAQEECELCNKPIGFGNKYTQHESGYPVHWDCALTEADRIRNVGLNQCNPQF